MGGFFKFILNLIDRREIMRGVKARGVSISGKNKLALWLAPPFPRVIRTDLPSILYPIIIPAQRGIPNKDQLPRDTYYRLNQ